MLEYCTCNGWLLSSQYPVRLSVLFHEIVVMLMSCSVMILGSGDLQSWALFKRHLYGMCSRDGVSFFYGSLEYGRKDYALDAEVSLELVLWSKMVMWIASRSGLRH